MAKRKKKSKASSTPTTEASAQPAQKPAAKSAKRSARKPAPKKHLSRSDRRALLAEAKSKGWTADQIARKAGVSKWTVYGWKKRSAKSAAGKRGRPVPKAAPAARRVSGALQSDFREMIAEIVRAEIGRLLGR